MLLFYISAIYIRFCLFKIAYTYWWDRSWIFVTVVRNIMKEIKISRVEGFLFMQANITTIKTL